MKISLHQDFAKRRKLRIYFSLFRIFYRKIIICCKNKILRIKGSIFCVYTKFSQNNFTSQYHFTPRPEFLTCEGPMASFPMPEFIDPVFAKTCPKRSFSMIENERFGLFFANTKSINSGTVASVRHRHSGIMVSTVPLVTD